MQGGDWATTVAKGPPETALQGPILDSAPYPQVLVAKAYSHTGKVKSYTLTSYKITVILISSQDLELVLYPGRKIGTFQIGLTRLQPGKAYKFQDEKTFSADSSGKATLEVKLDGRTRLQIELVNQVSFFLTRQLTSSFSSEAN